MSIYKIRQAESGSPGNLANHGYTLFDFKRFFTF